MNYVTEYLRLEKRAAANEEKADALILEADTLRVKSDEDKYEMCRIVHEAIESGEFTRKSFAVQVGKSSRNIGVLVQVWAKYGEVNSSTRPPYRHAYLAAQGRTFADNRRTQQMAEARALPAEEKAKLSREWDRDSEVQDAKYPHIAAERKRTPVLAKADAKAVRASVAEEVAPLLDLLAESPLKASLHCLADVIDGIQSDVDNDGLRVTAEAAESAQALSDKLALLVSEMYLKIGE